MTYLSTLISLFQRRPSKNCKLSSKEYKSKALKHTADSMFGVPTDTPQNNSITFPSKTSDPHHHSYGFGNQDAATNWTFSWLLLMDRLNTRNLLRRRNFHIEGNNYTCVLCNGNAEETAFHLFFSCSFSKSCWKAIGIDWRINLHFFQMMKRARQDFQHWFFMEVFIIATWHIWKQRNNLIFEGRRPTVRDWISKFIDEARLQAHRIKEDKRQVFLSWVDCVHL